MASASDLPVAVVKGPVFAGAIYPHPSLRCFTDIDLLVAPDAVSRLGVLLTDTSSSWLSVIHRRGPTRMEVISRDNENLMVEVQTDLIHAESLNRTVSLPMRSSPEHLGGAAELLLVALVHGAGHHYERLQQVVDICQAGGR